MVGPPVSVEVEVSEFRLIDRRVGTEVDGVPVLVFEPSVETGLRGLNGPVDGGSDHLI